MNVLDVDRHPPEESRLVLEQCRELLFKVGKVTLQHIYAVGELGIRGSGAGLGWSWRGWRCLPYRFADVSWLVLVFEEEER